MKTMSKAIVGTIAACAMALPAVSPALARDGYDYGHDGYDYARAGFGGRDNDRDFDRDREGGYGYRNDRTDPREAVERCTRAAQFTANRNGFNRAQVTDIRDVNRNDRGYTIKGRIAVNAMGHDWRRGDGDYGRGWNNDYRGWNSAMRGYDSGWFRCKVAYGRVVDLDFGGIRGL